MNRRRFGFLLATAITVGWSSGCATPKHAKRTSDPYKDDDETDHDLDRPDELRNFFKPTRRFGGLSSEAREIESDFGIQ